MSNRPIPPNSKSADRLVGPSNKDGDVVVPAGVDESAAAVMTGPAPLALAIKPTVLVIDDEKNIRATLSVCLQGFGCDVVAVSSGNAALAIVEQQPFEMAFLDLRLGDENGLELIPRLLAERPSLSIVVITAYATFDTAVEAIRRGAWEYLPKPFTPAQIRLVVEKAVERKRLSWQVANLKSELSSAVPPIELDSKAPHMQQANETLARACEVDVPLLLRGETGTGKTIAAREIHRRSRRSEHPFVVVNCPTLSEELLTSELFGHIRGAFTGAVKEQPGRVEAAHGGTLFLDEIGEIPPSLQAKLLRFLQDKHFERVGESRVRWADVRIIAATNRDLEADIQAGRFRQDLLYRLNVIEVVIPPLRDRREDILPLARRFIEFYARSFGRAVPTLSPQAEEAVLHYEWPGNLRELQNAIERALILWPAQIIEPSAFPVKMQGKFASITSPRLGGRFTMAAIENEHMRLVMAQTSSLEEAASVLGIDSSTLWRRRKKLDEEG